MRRAFLLDGASGSKCLGMNACPACMSGSPHSTATAKTFPATRCAALTVTPNAFANKMSAVYIDRSANTRNVIGPANAITGASCSFHRSVPHGKWSAYPFFFSVQRIATARGQGDVRYVYVRRSVERRRDQMRLLKPRGG